MSIKPKEKYIHPITLSIEENVTKNNIYPTTFQINKNKNVIYSQEKPIKKINLTLPPLLIDFDQYLTYYKFESVNDILNLIDSNDTFEKKKRILDAWIRKNFDDLKKNNKIVSKFYVYFFKKEFKIEFEMEEINNFIITWFKKNDKNIFHIDLYNQLYYYLKKKKIL
jgi:hypothetical protein